MKFSLYRRLDSDFISRMTPQPVLVEFDFPFPGPFGPELEAAVKDLAASIREEPGLLWKIWLEDADRKLAGGVYLFSDRATANAYIAKHTARLAGFGVKQPRCEIFDVNPGLTRATKGPIG